MEKLNIGGAEQMDMRREIAEGHTRWLDGELKTWSERHPMLKNHLSFGAMLVGGMAGAALTEGKIVPILAAMGVNMALARRFTQQMTKVNTRNWDEAPERAKLRKKIGQ